jgi:NAD-dependent SIR2 family protein deacetylase
VQFVTNGPDIPDALLQAHEEGRVVFFCGAGISYPAGLPGFKGLVEEIYQLIGTSLSDIEREAFERRQFDATLDLLERRLPGATPSRPPCADAGAETETATQERHRYPGGALGPGAQP